MPETKEAQNKGKVDPDPPPVPEPDPEPVFATVEDIPSVGWKAVELPAMKRWVRVRFIGSDEMAALSQLPVLTGFTSIMLKREELLQANQKIASANEERDSDKPKHKLQEFTAKERIQYAVEQTKYLQRVAHMAVIADPKDVEPRKCEDCTLTHPRGLWSVEQARLLNYADLKIIDNTATLEEEEELDPTSGSLMGLTDQDTSDSVNAGE